MSTIYSNLHFDFSSGIFPSVSNFTFENLFPRHSNTMNEHKNECSQSLLFRYVGCTQCLLWVRYSLVCFCAMKDASDQCIMFLCMRDVCVLFRYFPIFSLLNPTFSLFILSIFSSSFLSISPTFKMRSNSFSSANGVLAHTASHCLSRWIIKMNHIFV